MAKRIVTRPCLPRHFTLKQKIEAYSQDAPSGCREWTRPPSKTGYGALCWKSKTSGAHRLAYEAYIGPVPAGLQVLHTCDNRICVNPDHLFVGTIGDNMRDKVKKDRQLKGQDNGAAKLTEDQARQILAMEGTTAAIARAFGMGESQIARIRKRKNWKHLTMPPSPPT